MYQTPVPAARFARSLSGGLDRLGAMLPSAAAAEAAACALAAIGVSPRELRAEVRLAAGAARLPLVVRLPRAWDFDPGDGHALSLRLVCLEPAASGARLLLAWQRAICANGLPVGVTRGAGALAHRDGLDADEAGAFLVEALAQAGRERIALSVWRTLALPIARFVRFADEALAAAWGVKAAARFLHIITTGFDGELAAPLAAGPAHARPLVRTRRVPGAPAHATSAYDAAQALAWLAKERREAEERFARALEIPALMQSLLASN